MKVSQILRETNINQITGSYIRFKNGELEGKCAIGVLACESPFKSLHLNKDNTDAPKYTVITSYGITGYDDGLPTLDIDDKGEVWLYDMDNCGMGVADIIVRLNDNYKLSFKEIADFLEVTFDI